jgi:hypothetical protein
VGVTDWDLSQTPGLYPPAVGPAYGLLAMTPWPLLVLWWVIPVAISLWWILRCRPRQLAWLVILGCATWWYTSWQYYVGGTAMWLAAFVALGLRWRGTAALVLLKPTLVVFALPGIRSWQWWGVLAAIAALTLLGPWADYAKVVSGATDSGGPLYSASQLPTLAIPVVAWLGRSRPKTVASRAGLR